MLTYLLIILVVALALAPLGHFLPSKRQREVARLREYAALHGLFVEYRAAPVIVGMPVAASDPDTSRDVIYYGKRLPGIRNSPIINGAWVQGLEGWRSTGQRVPVPAQLQELSAYIVAASVDQSSCGCYWTESAGEEVVDQIRQVLECWSEALMR